MFNKLLNKNNRGQTGETITWIVATVIIIVILLVSILIASVYLGNAKKFSLTKQADSLASKSFFSYLLTKDSTGVNVYEQLKKEQLDSKIKLGDNVKNLGEKVFSPYRTNYGVFVRLTNKVGDNWAEIIEPKTIIPKKNWADFIGDKIKLDDDKYVSMSLFSKY